MKSSVSLLKSTGAGFDTGGESLQLTSATVTANGNKRCISAVYCLAFSPLLSRAPRSSAFPTAGNQRAVSRGVPPALCRA